MKQQKLSLKTLISLVLIILAVVSALSVTSSYFTATANRDGNINFSYLNVKFMYGLGTNNILTEEGGNKVVFVPDKTTPIARGETFDLCLSTTGEKIKYLGVNHVEDEDSTEKPCDAFVRFWIDAYIVNADNTDNTIKNYGEYFVFDSTDAENYGFVSPANQGTNALKPYYCVISKLESGYSTSICSKLKLSESAPVEILGSKIRIYFNLEAVQASNDAYLDVFKDGYLEGWKNL